MYRIDKDRRKEAVFLLGDQNTPSVTHFSLHISSLLMRVYVLQESCEM